jgi:cold shock CspA family protein
MTGTIKTTITRGPEDRFGFIIDEEGQDRYFHARDLEGIDISAVAHGACVAFEPFVGGRNGLRARRITVI